MQEGFHSKLLRVSQRNVIIVPCYHDPDIPGPPAAAVDNDIDRSFQRTSREQYIVLYTVLIDPQPNIIAPLMAGQGSFLPVPKEHILERSDRNREANEDNTLDNERLRLCWVN